MSEKLDSIRILLVEDSIGDAVLLRENLAGVQDVTFEVSHATSLEAGLGLAQAGLFDVMLLDLTLPDSEGVQTLERANAACSHLPIIVLTGLDNQDVGKKAVRIGAQDYLVKGKVNSNALSRCIRYSIERKGAQQALQKARDELEQRVRERTADLERLNRVLGMMSACNQALVHASDETTLLGEVCRIIVSFGKYKLAWVGFSHNDADKTVVPVACVGAENDYPDKSGITWDETERGQGPTGTAIRTGQVQISEDFLSDQAVTPWRESALARGFRSSIALPLVSSGRTIGALSIYAGQPAAFDERQIDALKELADDLAFGIAGHRTQDALRRAEHEVLEATEREQQRIGQDMHDSIQGGLAGISMMLGSMKLHLAKGSLDQARLLADADWLINAVKDTLTQTRGLVRGLCPLELSSDGLTKTISQLASTISELFGVGCDFRCETPIRLADETASVQLYRICQEAINNALKHSRCKAIVIRLDCASNRLILEVQDDGVGLPDDAGYRGGMGLGTMSYRARMIGADLVIGRAPEGGTLVRCSLPLK